jgi:two-component system catabolic regulation response regulator CreB
VIDESRCQVTLHGQTLHLTPTEYRLLCTITSRPGEVFSRQVLAQGVWGSYDADIDRCLDVHMRRLRGKINAAGQVSPRLITLRGFGYRLAVEESCTSSA